jgi:hypothetical protein
LQGCGIGVAVAREREKWEERLAEENRKREAQTIFGVIFVGVVAAALVWGGLAYLLRDLIPGDEFDSALDYAADQGWFEDAEVADSASWVSLTPAGVAAAKS